MHLIMRALLFIGVVTIAAGVGAQDNDPIAAKLDKAKQEYQAKTQAYRELVIKRFDDAESRAAKLGNKELVDQLASERAAFIKSESVPISLNVSDLIARRDVNRRLIINAYTRAIQDYTRAMNRNLADKVEQEFTTLRAFFEGSAIGGVRSWDGKVVRLTNVATGGALDVRPSPTATGKNDLVHAKASDSDSQLWLLKKKTEADQYQFLNRKNNLSINVPRSLATHAMPLIAYPDQRGAANEIWRIEPVGPVYQLISSNGLVISVAGPSDGAAVIQVKPSGAKQEFWKIEVTESD